MTMQEAFALAAAGTKVSHRFFSWDEYLTISNGVLIFEDGVECLLEEFKLTRNSEIWNEGWSVYEEPVPPVQPLPLPKKRIPPIPKDYLEVTFSHEDMETKKRVYTADFYHTAVKFAGSIRGWADITPHKGGSEWRIEL